MSNVAVILAGCGVYDGSEINEVVLSLLSLEEQGLNYQCFAPDIDQHHVINHLTGAEMPETRNVLAESARIVRGNIKPLSECNTEHYDALLVPGGFGVAKNLSDFALSEAAPTIHPEVLDVCQRFKNSKKPAGYLCIAPAALLAKIYDGVTCTIGSNANTAARITALGAHHQNSQVDEVVIDQKNKVVSTAAYMSANNLVEAKSGIKKLVEALSEMLEK
ncbi:MAG: enhancing lycopene biosynthesis protein 2 [Cellvibrionaceae bacterium]|jgi:enhancing lycopene biosynthesis protein 2